MNSLVFEAVLESVTSFDEKSFEVMLNLKGKKVKATIFSYERTKDQDESRQYVRLHLSQPLPLLWGDRFTLRGLKGPEFGVEGRVLNPLTKNAKPGELTKRLKLLERLSGSAKDMLLVKTQEAGIHGLREKDMNSFCSLSRETLVKLSRELEEEGVLKILAFLPLYLLAETSFDYLCDQILTFLSHFHSKNPGEIGIDMNSLKERFKTHSRILSLAAKQLSRTGRIKMHGNYLARNDFRVQLSPEEEKLLDNLEQMSLNGELHLVSFEELKKRFCLSSKNLSRMLDFLIQRKKIVKGQDGYIVHSSWLEELIQKLKNSGKRELTVSEFKMMTGLSRKYAIPLLELLDQMGVTRRRGPGREIL